LILYFAAPTPARRKRVQLGGRGKECEREGGWWDERGREREREREE